MRPLRTTLLAGAMLVLAGCGTTDAGTTSPETTGTAASEATTQSGAVDVEIVDFSFEPAGLEVAVGDEVTWTNQDDFAHTVTAGQPNEPTGAFDGRLGEMNAHESSGATFSMTFDEPGTYAYFCDLHPSMTGEIVVTGA